MFTPTLKHLTPAVFLLLTACATFTEQRHPAASGGQLNQICHNLKQEIIMNSVNNVPEEGGRNPAVDARLYKEYEQNKCPDVLREDIPR